MVRKEVKEQVTGLEGNIVNFRIGNSNPRYDQLILDFTELPDGIKIDNLIGLDITLEWRDTEFKGRIYTKHGNSHVRARFQKPLPGQVVLPGEATVRIE